MVSKASEDFPEPETPVTTVSALCGISTSMSLRLCTRAPRTMMLSLETCVDIEGSGCSCPAGIQMPADRQPNPSIISAALDLHRFAHVHSKNLLVLEHLRRIDDHERSSSRCKHCAGLIKNLSGSDERAA